MANDTTWPMPHAPGHALGPHPRVWTAEELELLGKNTDIKVATLIGVSRQTVFTKRRALGILSYDPRGRRYEGRESVPTEAKLTFLKGEGA